MSTSVWAAAVAHVLARSTGEPIDRTLSVTMHFHPDRVVAGVPILEALRRDGRYRSQFETGTSNGGLTAYPGGDRWQWESRMFGGCYDTGSPADRPTYGSLNHRRRPAGGSPRFGSAHLRIRPHVLDRVTFCYPDSVFEPSEFGVSQRMALIALAEADRQDLLDDYIEAHVHGPLVLAEDVAAVVLDPCYRDTPVADLAAALPCPVEWHHGFVLDAAELAHRPDYRGQEVVDQGLELAAGEALTAQVVGDAANTGRYDPQILKRVWHHIARFGRPAD